MILAQTSSAPGQFEQTQVDYSGRYVLLALDKIWEQITLMTPLHAVVFVAFGIIPIMYGWRIYKVLTVIGFGMIGLYIGMYVGGRFGEVLLGSIVGTGLMAFVAVPLMRWAVSILGAISGGLISAGIWYTFHLPEQFVWAGALVGMVAGGLIAFVIFKVSVMLFTSLAGASLILMGLFSLIYRYETFSLEPPTTHLNQLYYGHHWFLPLLLIGLTMFGIILQFRFVKSSKHWDIK